MKFDCGETRKEKQVRLGQERIRKEQWHKWFAWYPVRVGSHDCRWFEWVERKITISFFWGTRIKNKKYRAVE